MNEKKKITINIFASYFRSVVILFVGLLSTRWLLKALGEDDYGLFGLVGGLTVFISFINTLMSTAVSRFYAVAEGERQAGIPGAEQRITEWFNSALFIHFTLSTVLLIIGYPLGAFAIRHWLEIPGDRIDSCIWVLRFSCMACYAGMVNVPFAAMFIAKQRIAEYTLYLVLVPIFNIVFVYYISLHKEVFWLVKYSCFVSCLTTAVQILVVVRALQVFPECIIRKALFWDKARLKSLTSFAGWQSFSTLGVIVRNQGMSILGNIQIGPGINAALTIVNRVSSQTDFLSAGLRTAFAPAITNAYGAKAYDKMKLYTTETNRIGTLLILLLAMPLSLEIDKIFELWLKCPPQYSQGICLFVIAGMVVDKTSSGYMLAVNASGRIALYQGVLGSLLILALPLAYVLMKLGLGVMTIGYAIFTTTVLCALGRVFFAQWILNFPITLWLKKVLIPIGFVCAISATISYLPHLFMDESIPRIILTTCLAESLVISLSWFIVLDNNEKSFLTDKARAFLKKI